jgi:hypothetical protein
MGGIFHRRRDGGFVSQEEWMSGLRRICKLYGGMTVTGNDGKTIRYVWDYANDEPVPEGEMPFGSDRHKASERARWISPPLACTASKTPEEKNRD